MGSLCNSLWGRWELNCEGDSLRVLVTAVKRILGMAEGNMFRHGNYTFSSLGLELMTNQRIIKIMVKIHKHITHQPSFI